MSLKKKLSVLLGLRDKTEKDFQHMLDDMLSKLILKLMEFNCEENRQLWRKLYRKALIKWNSRDGKLPSWVDEAKLEQIIDQQEKTSENEDSSISLENLIGLDKDSWIEYIQNNIKANNAIIVCLCILSL